MCVLPYRDLFATSGTSGTLLLHSHYTVSSPLSPMSLVLFLVLITLPSNLQIKWWDFSHAETIISTHLFYLVHFFKRNLSLSSTLGQLHRDYIFFPIAWARQRDGTKSLLKDYEWRWYVYIVYLSSKGVTIYFLFVSLGEASMQNILNHILPTGQM